MPRQNDGTELYRRVTRLEVIRPVTPAVNTTTTASIGEGATLADPPTSYAGPTLGVDDKAPDVLVASLVITQPVHYPWARAGL